MKINDKNYEMPFRAIVSFPVVGAGSVYAVVVGLEAQIAFVGQGARFFGRTTAQGFAVAIFGCNVVLVALIRAFGTVQLKTFCAAFGDAAKRIKKI
uniref:Uncharacterized protein n=1 Tax=Romanomermis culicivorax TaxID=13658 RepID=A0A915JIA3_ROMCU